MSWPYEKLEPNECLVAKTNQFYHPVEVGDKVTVKIEWTNYFNTMRYQYNKAAEEHDWPIMEHIYTYDGSGEAAVTEFECTVKDLVAETYGKMPDASSTKQIMMEYEYYTDLIARSTTFNELLIDKELGEVFLLWMLTVDDLAYQYAD